MTELLSLKPDIPQAWCVLGKYYQGQRLFEKALYPLKQCSLLDPKVENLVPTEQFFLTMEHRYSFERLNELTILITL